MLTAEKEGGQVKAHNYWSERNYGSLRLTFLSEHRASIEPSRILRHREGSRDKAGFGGRRNTNPTLGAYSVPSPTQPQLESDSPTSEKPFVTVRKFALSHADKPFERMREITQLQYANWPDFGAPAHPAHLLGLVEQCDAVVRASYGGSPTGMATTQAQRPIVVHCSAGCGRTGTFCTVDSVIDILKQQRKFAAVRSPRSPPSTKSFASLGSPRPQDSGFFMQDNGGAAAGKDGWLAHADVDLIEKTVEEFRHQRLSAVQSLRQFVLCYESVLEWLAEQTPKSA